MHNNKYNNFFNNHIDICETCFFFIFKKKYKVLCKCNAHDEIENVHISFFHVYCHMFMFDNIQAKMARFQNEWQWFPHSNEYPHD
jgi:hypothetical protein